MKVYRIEHKDSKLGPYQHDGQKQDVINHGIHNSRKHLEDIDNIEYVKELLCKYTNIKFGFKDYSRLLNWIKDIKVLSKYGFIVKTYGNPIILYYNIEDTQVLFLEYNKDICISCGYDRLAYFSSLHYKYCTNFYNKIPWKISYEKELPLINYQR